MKRIRTIDICFNDSLSCTLNIRIISMLLLFLVTFNSYAQNYKENDFIVAISNNPTFTVGELIVIGGLNTSNTQFLSEAQYLNHNKIKSRYTASSFHKLYANASKAWGYFKELQNLSSKQLESLGYNYSQWDVFKSQVNSDLYNKYHYLPHSGVQRK